MGLFANLAAKSEMKVRDDVLSLLRSHRPDRRTGNVPLPCHIIDETHNGFFVDTGEQMIGVYRCQLHWWGRELDVDALAGLQSPDSAHWARKISSTFPTDMGSIRGGAPEFAAALAYML